MSRHRVLTALLAAACVVLALLLASPLGAVACAPDPSWSQRAHPGF